jgi:hypothetical protein
MEIEFQFNSVVVSQQEIQEKFPGLISMMNSYLPAQKTVKRRARRRKKTVSSLIDDIIDSLDAE